MGGNPRAMRPYVVRPSPLAQVELSRPLSTIQPAASLVRDPLFWKRFSVAIRTDEVDPETGRSMRYNSSSSSSTKKNGDEWLEQQQRERTRCRFMAMWISIVVMLIITGAAVVGWYFKTYRKQQQQF